MKRRIEDVPFVEFDPESRSGPLAEIGQVTIDVQVRGTNYRWSREHGLMRRQDGANVPIPGTESEAWKQLEMFLLLPPLVGAAVALAMAVKSLEGPPFPASESDPPPTKKRRRTRAKSEVE